jgi:hypothetical protein
MTIEARRRKPAGFICFRSLRHAKLKTELATRRRPEVRSLGATWNDTILWYAKAVHELRGRAVTKKASWCYLAAMHDFDQAQWIKLGYLARLRCGSKHSAAMKR